tara:strand:- start:490 stop:705 length:216 start_codon:yes stop_codon:yes gene_type:complete
MPLYEVAIYNKVVRNTVRSGGDVPEYLNPKFESTLYYAREARNRQVLDAKLEREFKSIDGYVVENIEKISE